MVSVYNRSEPQKSSQEVDSGPLLQAAHVSFRSALSEHEPKSSH